MSLIFNFIPNVSILFIVSLITFHSVSHSVQFDFSMVVVLKEFEQHYFFSPFVNFSIDFYTLCLLSVAPDCHITLLPRLNPSFVKVPVAMGNPNIP